MSQEQDSAKKFEKDTRGAVVIPITRGVGAKAVLAVIEVPAFTPRPPDFEPQIGRGATSGTSLPEDAFPNPIEN